MQFGVDPLTLVRLRRGDSGNNSKHFLRCINYRGSEIILYRSIMAGECNGC